MSLYVYLLFNSSSKTIPLCWDYTNINAVESNHNVVKDFAIGCNIIFVCYIFVTVYYQRDCSIDGGRQQCHQ